MKEINERIKSAAISAMADDYEDFETVYREVSGRLTETGFLVNREQVAGAIGELIFEGLADAYILSANPPYARVAEYSTERTDKLWFYLSPKGKALVGGADTQ